MPHAGIEVFHGFVGGADLREPVGMLLRRELPRQFQVAAADRRVAGVGGYSENGIRIARGHATSRNG